LGVEHLVRRDGTKRTSRDTGNDDVRLGIVGEDGTGSDDGIRRDFAAGQDDGANT
jgi:hypothetical protein